MVNQVSTASAPATTANLGPGFDIIALAVGVRHVMQQKYSDSMTYDFLAQKKTSNSIHPFVEKAKRIVLQQVERESFDVTDLAQALNLSSSQTYRKLKALTGMSTAIYIRQVRLEKARSLLRNESLSISDVAYLTGFNTPSYFSNCFKTVYGKSPSQYRETRVSP